MAKFMEILKEKIFIRLGLIIGSLLIAGIVGSLSIISAYSIPTNTMRLNIAKSIKIYDIEKDRYAWAPSIINSQMDNFTDSIMINISAFERGHSFNEIIRNAMLNPQYSYPNAGYKSNNLKYAYSETEKRPGGSHYTYGRYWHGYVIFLKPLLTFFTMSDIRIINMIMQLLLLLFVMFELYKFGGAKLSLPFLVAVLIFNPISCAMCLMYSCIYYITLASVLIALKYKLYQTPYYYLFFLWVGIITSFFDLLSYPLISLGLNLILFILLTEEKVYNKMCKVIISSICWGTGYAIMWIEKWVIGYMLTGKDIISDAINSVNIRTSDNVSNIFSTIVANIKAYDNIIFCVLLILGGITILIFYLSGKYKLKINLSFIVPLLFVSLYPFMWFMVLKNHSFIHYWMTHRILMITIVSLVYIVVYSVEKVSSENIVNIFNHKAWRNNFTKCSRKLTIAFTFIFMLFICYKFLPITNRVDIFAKYTKEPIINIQEIGDKRQIPEASWMTTSGNRGYVLQKNGYSAKYLLSSNEDIDIKIILRGPDKRDATGKRIEEWVKYTDFQINGEKILSAPIEVWHDQPFKYAISVKKGKKYKIHIKWTRVNK